MPGTHTTAPTELTSQFGVRYECWMERNGSAPTPWDIYFCAAGGAKVEVSTARHYQLEHTLSISEDPNATIHIILDGGAYGHFDWHSADGGATWSLTVITEP